MPNAVRHSVIVALAAAALGQPGEVSSSMRIMVTPDRLTLRWQPLRCLQDRAVALRPGLITGIDQAGERITDSREFLDALLEVGDAGAGHCPSLLARIRTTVGQVQ